ATPVAVPAAAPPDTAGEAAEERISVASQWQLMWWRFRKHRLAMLGAITIVAFYVAVLIADFLAYADPEVSDAQRGLIPPQPAHLFDGGRFAPYVNPLVGRRDPVTFKRVYTVDEETKLPLAFFAQGYPYRLLGLIPTDRHLLGVEGGDAEKSLFIL